ncbi:MAG: GNAT family N-acetyltransferase [Polyangiaceae bacterium]|nr:GNAT family N-acetyltransferase [Polyangiaceae bacterium]
MRRHVFATAFDIAVDVFRHALHVHRASILPTAEDRARALELLWKRGDSADPRAIEAIRAANPKDEAPAFLRGPRGSTLSVALGEGDAEASAELLRDTYWNDRFSPDSLVRAAKGSNAWVGAHDEQRRLVGAARAVTDGAKHAWIYDVIVEPSWRASGLGQALMRLLLDHPAVRGAAFVHLGTRDAQLFYRKLGFVESNEIERPYASTTMTLARAPRGRGNEAP